DTYNLSPSQRSSDLRKIEKDVCQFGFGFRSRKVYHRKKALKPCEKRSIIKEITTETTIGISRACQVLTISRSSFGYQSIKDDNFLYEKLMELSENHPKEGVWKCYFRLRNQGEKVNHKRVHRIYKKAGLSLRRKAKKRKIERVKEPLIIPDKFTKSWKIGRAHV